MNYNLSPQARIDLVNIGDYIAEDSLERSIGFIRFLYSYFHKLAESPFMGRACPDLERDLRCFPVKNYMIFYRVKNEVVEIVRVIHDTRDISALFNDEGPHIE